jgi:hypothetical protein
MEPQPPNWELDFSVPGCNTSAFAGLSIKISRDFFKKTDTRAKAVVALCGYGFVACGTGADLVSASAEMDH